MAEETAATVAPPQRDRVGDRLRSARENVGLSITDIAQRTRIPQRHLEAIEVSNYGSLPSITYAMGFARAYARALGMSDVEIAHDLRGELANTWEPKPRHEPYDFSEPARVPPRGVALAGVLVAVLILVGVGLWYGTSIFRSEEAAPVVTAQAEGTAPVAVQTPVAAPTPTEGRVVLTATDEVWVRVYDAKNQTLMIKTMAPGERYEVPLDADQPKLNVGRPDKLAVTIDGAAVPPLGTGERAIKDVGIDAQTLRSRGA